MSCGLPGPLVPCFGVQSITFWYCLPIPLNPAGNFDVEKALTNVRIFRRRKFDGQRRFESTSIFQRVQLLHVEKALKNRRRNFDVDSKKLTVPAGTVLIRSTCRIVLFPCYHFIQGSELKSVIQLNDVNPIIRTSAQF